MEPSNDPVWKNRSQKLQDWLKEHGPKTTDELHREYARGSESMLTNILAYGEGIYFTQFSDGRWGVPGFSKAASKAPVPTSEGCPEKSESSGAASPEKAPDPPDQVECPPDISHPPT
jgi:hypothetical protein